VCFVQIPKCAMCATTLIARSVPTDTAPFLVSPVRYVENKPMHIIFEYELTVLQSVLYKSPNVPYVPMELIARSVPTDTALFHFCGGTILQRLQNLVTKCWILQASFCTLQNLSLAVLPWKQPFAKFIAKANILLSHFATPVKYSYHSSVPR